MTPTLPSVAPTTQMNPFVKVAMAFWLLELFLMYSRFFDSIGGGLHIPSSILACLVVTALISGRVFRGLNSNLGRILIVFLCWVPVTMVFSIWRSGTMPTFELFLGSFLGFLFASGLLSSIRHVLQSLYTLAISILVAALLGFYFGNSFNGRLEIATGTYRDANEYAMCLLMGVPFWLLIAASTRSVFIKIASMLCLVPLFWAFFKTGSRGGLVGLGALIIVLLLQASFSKKIVILIATLLGIALVSAVLPSYLKARYLSTFDTDVSADASEAGAVSDSERQYLASDVGSFKGRKNMLVRSIEITLDYPIFGVGPGNFPLAFFTDGKRRLGKNFWMGCHSQLLHPDFQ